MKHYWRSLLLSFCLLQAAAARADGVLGLVLDVQGGAEVVLPGPSSRLQLLSYLKPGMQLRLDRDGRASLSHYGARLIYQLSGPLLAEVDRDGVRVLQGAAPSTRSLAEKVVAAALGANTGAAAVRMRMVQDITLLGPRHGSVVLSRQPYFRWESSEAASYQVTLERADGVLLAQANTDRLNWQLSAGQALEDGQSYRWRVSYRSDRDGELHQASAQFSVVTAPERASVAALRPEADAGIDELVLYATLLQGRQLLDDARAVWAEIAARRPDLSKAASLAR
ncbi:MAG: hypothetical protein ACEQSK_01690 [Sphingomonadaceae bacterium]